MLYYHFMPTRATSIATVVIDDEKLALEELSYLLKDYPEIEVIGSAENGLQAVDLIGKLEPDLVFLDVQMPGLDGMESFESCGSNRKTCPTSSS